MPRIVKVDLNQVNLQIDKIDNLVKRTGALENAVGNLGFQAVALDYLHAPPTTNNIVFTWTGGTLTLSWTKGFLQDKNASVQTLVPTKLSTSPSVVHTHGVAAGSKVVSASTWYWTGWDPVHQQMVINSNAAVLHQNFNVLIICQLFTGTAGQTGTAGGGGSRGGVDLSGMSYKNF
jgi:hypothetical protein